MVSRSQMLQRLPPFLGNEDWLAQKQTLRDIVREVLNAHQVFAGDYDQIAGLWLAGDPALVPVELYRFCRSNLTYREEAESWQTTRSPAGILAMRTVDCKHYAGLIAGILDAINRTGRYWYDWTYRFAAYGSLTPEHVFVVIKPEGLRETWIDPVPEVTGFNSRNMRPLIKWDKQPGNMALVRLSGIGATSKGFRSTNVVSRTQLHDQAACIRGTRKQTSVRALGGYSPPMKIGGIPPGWTPDDLGIPKMIQVFDYFAKNGGNIPNYQALIQQDPPIQYWLNGQRMKLPTPIVSGTCGWSSNHCNVPPLPQGLQVYYTPTFAGYSVPPYMIRPVVVGSQLQVAPWQITSNPNLYFSTAQADADATHNLLVANNKVLYALLTAALLPLIWSYSPTPYGSDGSGLGALTSYIWNSRNRADYLRPDDKSTVLQSAVNVVAQVFNAVAPIEALVANAIIPGSGALVGIQNKLLQGFTSQNTAANAPPQPPASALQTSFNQQQQVAAGGGTGSSTSLNPVTSLVSTIKANPVPALLIGAGALALAIALMEGSGHKKAS